MRAAAFLIGVSAVIEAVEGDDARLGGLLSRATLRRAGELLRLVERAPL